MIITPTENWIDKTININRWFLHEEKDSVGTESENNWIKFRDSEVNQNLIVIKENSYRTDIISKKIMNGIEEEKVSMKMI